MTDRTVSVKLQAQVSDYMAKFSAAGKATTDFARKVETAKAKSAEGYRTIGHAALIGGGLVVAGFGLAIHEMASFEGKMALVRTLAKASPAQMSQLSHAALTVGQAYGYTAGQVADAEAELVKAGVSVKDIMGGALSGALTLAAAGQTDVATATTIAATAMTQFALKGRDVPHIADLLASGADKALGSVVDLGYALDQAGPQAHIFGISVEETVGTLAAFANAGQLGERGGTVFSQMLIKLSAPGRQASDIMQSLGIHVYKANGQFIGMAGLAGQLQTKMAGLTMQERNHALAVIFGSRAIRGASILYQLGAQGVKDWTARVNDSGFASLQASGKMNSLTGDVTKLKAALQAALIGVGEGANSPLRGMTQDLTGLVTTWMNLPGPVKAGAEALTLVAGATALAGGAALIAIPRWAAMNLALKETRIGAINAGTALKTMGKATAAITVMVGVYEGAKALGHLLADDTEPSVNAFTSALVDLGGGGSKASKGLLQFISEIASAPDGFGFQAKAAAHLDQAFADLVTGGHLDLAKQDFAQISAVLHKSGMTTAQITKLFPQFAQALSDSATSAKVAGDGVDQYGNAVGDAATQIKNATDAQKAYSDQLHAMADPLFAMNKALQDLAGKQAAAAKATRKHGAASREARQANIDLASSALDVKVAASDLTTAVATGAVTMKDATGTVRGWAKAGLITKAQADSIIASFDALIGRAKTLSDLHPHIKVSADTGAATNQLVAFKRYLDGLHDKTVHLYAVQSGPGHSVQQPNKASGGPIRGPGSGTSDSVPFMGSNGEFVVRANGSNLGDAMHFFGVPGFASGGAIGGLDPGSVARAVMRGVFDQMVDRIASTLSDKAAKAFRDAVSPLAHSLDHLSGVMSAAQSYRTQGISSLTDYASASGVVGSGVGTAAYKTAKANDLRKFARLYNQLEARHLDPQTLGEFFAAGPAAIPAMQDLLRPGQIRKVNDADKQVARIVAGVAGHATADQYGRQISRLVSSLPRDLERAMERAIRKELQIDVFVGKDGHQVSRRRRAG